MDVSSQIKYISNSFLQLVAVVIMEQTVYHVFENESQVEVCVVVANATDCPVDFDFSLILSTHAMTATGRVNYKKICTCIYMRGVHKY